MLQSLRAVPFDAAALKSALSAISGRNAARLQSASTVIGDYLSALSPEARAAFADRLEQGLNHERDKAEAKAKAANKG